MENKTFDNDQLEVTNTDQKTPIQKISSWVVGHKKSSAIVGLFALINGFTIMKDVFDGGVWTATNWSWLISFSNTAYFPWFTFFATIGFIFYIINRAANADALHGQQIERERIKLNSETREMLESLIHERLGKYDVKLDAFFIYQTENKRNDLLRHLSKELSDIRERVIEKLTNWPFKAPHNGMPGGAIDRGNEYLDALDIHFHYHVEFLNNELVKTALTPSGAELAAAPKPPGLLKVDYEPVSEKYKLWYCQILRFEKLVSDEMRDSNAKLQNCREVLNVQ